MELLTTSWARHLNDHQLHAFLFMLFVIILLSCSVSFLCVQLYRLKYLSPFVLRKLFHFFVFTLAWYIQTFFGLLNLIIFSTVIFTLVLVTATVYPNNAMYKFLQNKNASNRKLSVIYPLFATAIGGILSNVLFAQFAAIGYLAAGWGDVSGALIGNIMSSHKLNSAYTKNRSLSGSCAVFLFSTLATYIGLYFIHAKQPYFLISIVIGLICAIVEAVSKSEFDNLTLQLAVTSVLFLLI